MPAFQGKPPADNANMVKLPGGLARQVIGEWTFVEHLLHAGYYSHSQVIAQKNPQEVGERAELPLPEEGFQMKGDIWENAQAEVLRPWRPFPLLGAYSKLK